MCSVFQQRLATESNAGYEEHRAEAVIHREERKRYERRASIAFNRKHDDDGHRYKQMAQYHLEKEQEANFQAAEKIFKKNNSNRKRLEIDLHGLHPQEAVQFAEQSILAKRQTAFKCMYPVFQQWFDMEEYGSNAEYSKFRAEALIRLHKAHKNKQNEAIPGSLSNIQT
ncbi:hypothetical protein EB796_014536 [Bugula neritina]|uniref:DUF1771 domain-containing protein n=1 Tax=Bugula neritina TaxID=10212 RepID=A0A7J7JP10_BUGNE|nr:hypothetical protein EB796_014536 [Bugula neritina]